jgi:DNA mismatch repair protein MutS
VDEDNGKVRLLHRIAPGGADKSYGIHVARLAGLPRAVVNRAEGVLERLEASAPGQVRMTHTTRSEAASQLSLFGADDGLAKELSSLDVDSLTPLEAIAVLYTLRERAKRPT